MSRLARVCVSVCSDQSVYIVISASFTGRVQAAARTHPKLGRLLTRPERREGAAVCGALALPTFFALGKQTGEA